MRVILQGFVDPIMQHKGATSIRNLQNPSRMYNYKRYVSTLSDKEALTVKEFKQSRWSNYFTLDLSATFKNGKANPNHIFEIFASIGCNIATDVRVALLQNVADDVNFYMVRNTVCLESRKTSFETWVKQMGDESVFCDELGLMGLCSLYRQHCVVLTNGKLWSSIEMDQPMSLTKLMSLCSIRLVYMGKLRFGKLVWRPKPPTPVKTVPNVQFNIVEEYTLEEPDTQDIVTAPAVVDVETVQTSSGLASTAHSNTSSTEQKTQDGKDVHVSDAHLVTAPAVVDVETVQTSSGLASTAHSNVSSTEQKTQDGKDVHVSVAHLDAAKTMLTLHSFPVELTDNEKKLPTPIDSERSESSRKRKLSLCLNRLSEIEIDIWCGNTKEYYRSRAKNKHRKSRTSTEEPTPDQLLARAKSLINQSKEWIETSVTIKEETTTKGVSIAEATGTLVHVKIDDKKDALASLHAATIAQLSAPSNDVLPVGTKSAIPVKETPSKQTHKVGCKMCVESFESVKALNDHHRNNHGVVKCDFCVKSFSTRSALDKHLYVHRKLEFICVTCGKQFAFQSRLDQHKLVHQTKGNLKCTKRGCLKTFKGVGDLNRHIRSHDDDTWYTCDSCLYKNKDKRNTMSHMRVHSKPEDGRYVCGKCSKIMRYSTQFLRHKETGCKN